MIHQVIESWRNGILGTLTPPLKGSNLKNVVFFTISPPTNTKVDAYIIHNGKRKFAKIPYDRLSLKNQQAFINRYFNVAYKPYIDKYIYIYEINKAGNLHAHGLIYDKEIKSEYDLRCLRDTINKHPRTLLMVKNPKLFNILNCVVYADNLNETMNYISKDLDQSIKHFGYMSDSQDDTIIDGPEVYFN